MSDAKGRSVNFVIGNKSYDFISATEESRDFVADANGSLEIAVSPSFSLYLLIIVKTCKV